MNLETFYANLSKHRGKVVATVVVAIVVAVSLLLGLNIDQVLDTLSRMAP